jgi:hypothetical protein
MPDSGDSSSHYDEELPSSESEEEEVEMPATWAERQQMGILHSWNTRQAEETRAWRYNAHVERDNAELLRHAEETSLLRFPIEERGRLLIEAERQEALRPNAQKHAEYESRAWRLVERRRRDAERRRRDEERRARNMDAGEGPSGAS